MSINWLTIYFELKIGYVWEFEQELKLAYYTISAVLLCLPFDVILRYT